MQEKYYGFNGYEFVLLGEFDNINDAFEYELSNDLGPMFFICSENEWKTLINESPFIKTEIEYDHAKLLRK
jgi:hypothetical protein